MKRAKPKRKPVRRKAASKRAAFLAAYAECGNHTRAAELARCNRQHVYRWLEEPDFAAAFQEAGRQATERLEEEARRRAVDGVVEPVYQGGRKVGQIKRYSDVLLIFLLKGLKPEKYRDHHKHEFTGEMEYRGTLDIRNVCIELEGRLGRELEEFARARLGAPESGLPGGLPGADALSCPAPRAADGSTLDRPAEGEGGG